MDGVIVDSFAQRLGNHINPLIVHHMQPLFQFLFGKSAEIIAEQAVHMLL